MLLCLKFTKIIGLYYLNKIIYVKVYVKVQNNICINPLQY